MPEQPRRILEKSSTVRRRYQRSKQRFRFTASQIERIEREEAKEREAKKRLEKEKKRLSDKRKKAEKEKKAREERKRLGLPDPNIKVPASQPLLSNFLCKKAEQKNCDGQSGTETICGGLKIEFNPENDDDPCETPNALPSDTECEEESANEGDHARPSSTGMNQSFGNERPMDGRLCQSRGRASPQGLSQHNKSAESAMAESFTDDTATMLENLDPKVLEELGERAKLDTDRQPELSLDQKNIALKDERTPSPICEELQPHSPPDNNSPQLLNKSIGPIPRTEALELANIDIYEDQDDLLGFLCTQDLGDEFENASNKENVLHSSSKQQKFSVEVPSPYDSPIPPLKDSSDRTLKRKRTHQTSDAPLSPCSPKRRWTGCSPTNRKGQQSIALTESNFNFDDTNDYDETFWNHFLATEL